MIALTYDSNGVHTIKDRPKPIPPIGETIIRVRMAGICRTDLEISKGYMGFEGVLGHEFVGEIDESIGDWKAGDRVVGEINAGCGQCCYCGQGLERHCPNRSTLGIFRRQGCMAEWTTLPTSNLLAVPDSITDEQAVFTEPLAAALEIFEQILVQPTDRVCILGDGKLGLSIAMVFAHKHEGEMLLIGHHSDKLALVEDRMDVCLEKDVPESFAKTWDVVVEATGTSSGLKKSMHLTRPRGTIVLKSTMAHAEPLDLTPLVVDEINVVGSRCGRFAPALSLLQRGVIPVERLIEAVYPMEEASVAWERALRPGAKKVLLQIACS